MDKLTFFAMKSPEKLDRIGEYLAQRLSRDIYRQRYQYVFIAMEALDILLVTCHAQSLNLFVESFLKMVQKLLETCEPSLQILATASFVKFANIEEDTPSYHRRYDFFVSHFSALCHSKESTSNDYIKLRVSGLQGLHGVIRKTVSDDLHCNIWKSHHMDKIIPSLLFNMQAGSCGSSSAEPESPKDEENPACVAETVFRDFVCRASYGNINAVIKPVLTHLDNHNLWVPNDFAVRCFKIIMYSVQAQYGYMVVQTLMNHLDESSKEYAKTKASIVGVLSETVLISAGGSIGPSVLEVFNTLLRHLKISVEISIREKHKAREERHFQEAVINTIGDFANNLPDYQKIEIMMFVMGKVPLPGDREKRASDVMLQTMLLKSLLKVATKYQTVSVPNALPVSFLDPLLKISLVEDPGIRRLVQEIFHTLLDRHDNLSKLKTVELFDETKVASLVIKKPQKPDLLFIKKNGPNIYWHLHENACFTNNKVDNFESIYITMVLLYLEISGDEVLLDLLRLVLEIQESAMSTAIPVTHKCAMHALVAAFLSFLSQTSDYSSFASYVFQVIEERKRSAPYYLPTVAFNRTNTSSSYPADSSMKDKWLFSISLISDSLKSSGLDVSRLTAVVASRPTSVVYPDPAASASEANSVMEPDSPLATPVLGKRSGIEEITFESMKKLLENDVESEMNEKLQQQKIYESFRSGPFEEIVARSEAKNQKFQKRLNEVLESISDPTDTAKSASLDDKEGTADKENGLFQGPVSEMNFPQLFVY